MPCDFLANYALFNLVYQFEVYLNDIVLFLLKNVKTHTAYFLSELVIRVQHVFRGHADNMMSQKIPVG